MIKAKLFIPNVLLFVLTSMILRSQSHSIQSKVNHLQIDSLTATILVKPSFNGQLAKDTIGSKLQIKLLKRRPSSSIFSEEWFYAFGSKTESYKLPTYSEKATTLPDNVPLKYRGHTLLKALYGKHTIFIYEDGIFDGRFVLIMDSLMQKVLHFYDFKAYYDAPEIKAGDEMFVPEGVHWAKIQDSVLYVSNYHRTYAQSTFGKNAYLTAINLNTNKVIWRSMPLICNTGNFLIYKDKLLCGYGFTNEPDYLHIVNRFSGKLEQKIPLKSGPDYLILEDNILHVRTYDSEYEFQLNE